MPKHRYDQRLSKVPKSIYLLLTKIGELKGRWIGGAHLSPQVLGRLKKSVLITSAGASTRIEGSELSDADVEKLMKGIQVNRWKDRDQQEVKGYYELLQIIFATWKHIAVSESSIKHLHQEMLKYAQKDERHRGDYK